jgi:Uma2 family endonuclease
MALPVEDLMSPEEYLAIEREAATKSELINGRMVAMSGAAIPHNLLVASLVIELGSRLPSRCRVFSNDQRVRVPETDLFTYPDVTVVCGPLEIDPLDRHTIRNPTLLIEVLSPSTEAYDRGAKFAHYRRLVSLQEYWLVSPDQPCIERLVRSGDCWTFHEHSGPGASVPLTLAGTGVPLDDVYARVSLPGDESETAG